MIRFQKENAVSVENAQKMEPHALEEKIIIGVLVDKELPVYAEEYDKVRDRAKGEVVTEDLLGPMHEDV